MHQHPMQAEAIRKVGDFYNRTRLALFVKGLFSKWLAWQHSSRSTRNQSTMNFSAMKHPQNTVSGHDVPPFAGDDSDRITIKIMRQSRESLVLNPDNLY